MTEAQFDLLNRKGNAEWLDWLYFLEGDKFIVRIFLYELIPAVDDALCRYKFHRDYVYYFNPINGKWEPI